MNKFIPFKVSHATLRGMHACRSQLNLFGATFGYHPIEVTKATLLRANKAGLDIDWFAGRVVFKSTTPSSVRIAYSEAREKVFDTKYREEGEALQPIRYTKRGNYRARQDWKAIEAALKPINEKFDRALLAVNIKYLGSGWQKRASKR